MKSIEKKKQKKMFRKLSKFQDKLCTVYNQLYVKADTGDYPISVDFRNKILDIAELYDATYHKALDLLNSNELE